MNLYIYSQNYTALKKILLIGIVAILAYSQIGYYFVIRNSQDQQKEHIKEQILNKLSDDELEVISFTDNQQQILWEEDGKEFFFKGEMFDVVKSKTVNGKVLLYCINDKKEKSLVDNYNNITKQNSASNKKAKDNIDNSFNLFVDAIEASNNFIGIKTKSSFPAFIPGLQSVTPQIISPPPQA